MLWRGYEAVAGMVPHWLSFRNRGLVFPAKTSLCISRRWPFDKLRDQAQRRSDSFLKNSQWGERRLHRQRKHTLGV